MAVEMKDEGYIPAWRPWWREAAATRCRRRELRRRVSSCYDEKKKLAVFWGVTLPSSSFMEIFQIFLSSRRMLRNLTQQFKMKKKIKKKKWRGRQTPTKNNWRKDDEVNFNCPIGVKRASSLQTLKFKKKILIRFKKLKSNQQRQNKKFWQRTRVCDGSRNIQQFDETPCFSRLTDATPTNTRIFKMTAPIGFFLLFSIIHTKNKIVREIAINLIKENRNSRYR